MSELEVGKAKPAVGKSELDLLIEIRDLLQRLVDRLVTGSGGR